MRYTAVLICGVLCGIAGAYLSRRASANFGREMTAGRGYIALAALIFAKWRPWYALAACLLFGFLEAISNLLPEHQPRPLRDPGAVHPGAALYPDRGDPGRALSARRSRRAPEGNPMSRNAEALAGLIRDAHRRRGGDGRAGPGVGPRPSGRRGRRRGGALWRSAGISPGRGLGAQSQSGRRPAGRPSGRGLRRPGALLRKGRSGGDAAAAGSAEGAGRRAADPDQCRRLDATGDARRARSCC